jgi:hypothetical protein
VKIPQQEHTVEFQRAEEERQIEEYPGKLPDFMDGFLF